MILVKQLWEPFLGWPQVNVCADTELMTIHINEMYPCIGLIGAIASLPWIFTSNE